MSDKEQKTKIEVGRQSWFHPNALSLVLGGCTYDMAHFRENKSSLLYEAENSCKGYAGDNWRLNAQFVRHGGADIVPISEQRNGVMTNMNTAQKDHVLRTIEADYLQTTFYQFGGSKKHRGMLLARMHQRLSDHSYQDGSAVQAAMMPKIMTTNAAYFPLKYVPEQDRTLVKSDAYREDYFEVNPIIHQLRYLPEIQWQDFYKDLQNGFYPTQFVALHRYGVCDETRHVFLGDHGVTRFQKDPSKLNAPIFPQDMWMVMAVEPYRLRYLACALDICTTRDLLGNLEAEFINRYYDEDSRLRELDAMMQEIPGSKPAHYSHFSDKNIARYEEIRTMYPMLSG